METSLFDDPKPNLEWERQIIVMTFCEDNFGSLEDLPQEFLDQFYAYASTNLIKLHMFISTPFATEYERDVETSRISFVANIGGMYIGGSLIVSSID